VITGDGDMLMSLGRLATVATQQHENLAIVVLRQRESSARPATRPPIPARATTAQPTRAPATDLSLIAKGCGIADAGIVREAGEVAQLVKDVRTRKGPVFRVVKVMVEKLEFVMPPRMARI